LADKAFPDRPDEEGHRLKITIPHTKQIGESGEVTKATLNDLIRSTLDASTAKPTALEIYDSISQRFLFVRERQIYAAAELTGGQFNSTSIRDFLLGATNMSFPRATWYELNTKIVHSILVVVQKKPGLRVMTSLVDLDELLDRIEKEGKSCIVAATREDFLSLLRYEKGKAAALCFEHSVGTPREPSFREEFLIKVYSNAAERPMNICIYEDFLVSYAPDAKNLPEGFEGRYADVFLSKPPVVILRFKDREIGRWEMDRPRLRIGRTPDNDIVIDNLGVSRLHAVIEEEKGAYSVRDCDSLNGTVVNGERLAIRLRAARLDRTVDQVEVVVAGAKVVRRQRRGETRFAHAGTLTHPRERALPIGADRLVNGVLPGGQRDPHGKQIRRLEAGIDLLQPRKARDEQAGDGEQRQRQRELRDDEPAPQQSHPTPAANRARACREPDCPRPHQQRHRRCADDDPGGQRQTGGQRHRANVQARCCQAWHGGTVRAQGPQPDRGDTEARRRAHQRQQHALRCEQPDELCAARAKH
jgi:hypothetical protein